MTSKKAAAASKTDLTPPAYLPAGHRQDGDISPEQVDPETVLSVSANRHAIITTQGMRWLLNAPLPEQDA